MRDRFWTVIVVTWIVIMFFLVGCGGKNSTIIAELSPMGQLNPFYPGIIGGCLVDSADEVELEVIYENGKCTVKTKQPQKLGGRRE